MQMKLWHLYTRTCQFLAVLGVLCGQLQATAADGFWIIGADLPLTGQADWYPYNSSDSPEGGYMGWIFAGKTNRQGVIDLKRNLPAGKYYVLIKLIDYQG